jgi:hypothetical protein
MRFKLGADVVLQHFGSEALLLDLRTEQIHQLNHTGAYIVGLLNDSKTMGEVRRCLLADFDVTEAQMEQELTALLGTLIQQSLLIPVPTS